MIDAVKNGQAVPEAHLKRALLAIHDRKVCDGSGSRSWGLLWGRGFFPKVELSIVTCSHRAFVLVRLHVDLLRCLAVVCAQALWA